MMEHTTYPGGAAALGAALSLSTLPAAAQDYLCALDDGTMVDFSIDPNQFVDAITPEEPIRRKFTFVRMGNAHFSAEPFIIGDVRGFHADGMGGASIMFVTRPDGSATFANTTTGERKTGTCEVQ